MKIYKDIQQNTVEWDELRKLRLTGSNATAIASNGAGLKTYIKNKILDLIRPNENRFYGYDMERGDLLEPIARTKYEFEKGVDVVQVGFIALNDRVGFSPDGLVGDDGKIEIKARNDVKHLDLLLTEKIDSSTLWQIQFGLLVSARKWCDFISYNPNFKKSLFVKRVKPDPSAFEKLEKGIKSGVDMLNEYLKNPIVKSEMKK